MTKNPVLLGQDMSEQMAIQPVEYRLRENLTPLSAASITVSATAADAIPLRSFVRLYSPHGDAGVYRVISRSTSAGMSAELTLQHGLCTLSDHMHPGESEETTSCRALLTKLLSNQETWVLGTVDVPDDEPLTWQCSFTNDLQGLTDIMKELPGYCLDFDQTALPWVLHVRKKPEDVQCEARMARNLADAQIVTDTSEMCNVAYADGLPEPIVADTVEAWGRIERKVSADGDLPADMLDKTVRRYLDAHKDPRITITLTAVELSRLTGEPLDCFRLGTLCRCIIDGTETVQRIEAIDWRDPIGAPEDMVLTLSTAQKDMSVTVAGLVVDTRVRFEQMRGKLLVEAQQIAFLSEQMLLRATKEEADLLSTRISVVEIGMNEVSGELTLKASQGTVDELSSQVSSAELRLDAAESSILLKADQIVLDGYVKADDLETETLKVVDGATLASLKTGAFNCSGIGTISTLYVGTGAVIPSAVVGGSQLSVSTLTIGKKSCTFFAPSDATFDLSDMPGFDDALDAARTEGASSAMLIYKPSSASVTGTLSGAHDYALSVALQNVYGNPIITFTGIAFDARDAYDNGYDDGFAAGKAAMGLVRDGMTVSVAESDTKSMTCTLYDTHKVTYDQRITLTPGTMFTGTAGAYYLNAKLMGSASVGWT